MANTIFDVDGQPVDSVECDRYAHQIEKLPSRRELTNLVFRTRTGRFFKTAIRKEFDRSGAAEVTNEKGRWIDQAEAEALKARWQSV